MARNEILNARHGANLTFSAARERPRYQNVAADVSRLKLPSLAQRFECSAETNDPAHARCYKKSELQPAAMSLAIIFVNPGILAAAGVPFSSYGVRRMDVDCPERKFNKEGRKAGIADSILEERFRGISPRC